MGEVYRARDSRLGRDVALKIVPELFSTSPDGVNRLKREAEVLASLNHSNIAAIYGFEDERALVLEFVDGLTLADRLLQGPLPLDEAVSIAGQIAAALSAAHERSIIHRDLKPSNIKLRPDGTFTVRYSMPNARQVIPAVAASANGLEQRTVVLAVERNTKTMEPLLRDGGNNSQD